LNWNSQAILLAIRIENSIAPSIVFIRCRGSSIFHKRSHAYEGLMMFSSSKDGMESKVLPHCHHPYDPFGVYMQSPVQIEFDGLPPSDEVTDKIWSYIDHLEKLFPRITDARVVVCQSHHHHQKGNLFKIRIEMNVPGKRLVVAKEPGNNHAHEDVYVALRDAFQAMQRILQDHVRRMRGDVKIHEAPLLEGHIIRILPYEQYGFIRTADEREFFFDANALISGDFDHLEVGAPVRFHEEMGEKGPQASTVYAG
jgi:cold shock CspA family protein/ribosome-associated translation inhibitor RaiA